jgi:ion channel-forming bestrophin family protein
MAPPVPSFWRDAVTFTGSVTPRVLPAVAVVGASAAALVLLVDPFEEWTGYRVAVAVTPYEYAGALLGLLLVLRTNTGYDRWWEARRLWGGITSQCRNLAVVGFTHGPADPAWRDRLLALLTAFPYVVRAMLRDEPVPPEAAERLGPAAAGLAKSGHAPGRMVVEIARLFHEAVDKHGMNGWAFAQAERERSVLIESVGGCERIVKTPLPRVYSIKIRRFLFVFILTLPLAMIHKIGSDWLIPVVTMMVAYAILSLDRIGVELQNPFDSGNLSHLPLDELSEMIESNVTEYRDAAEGRTT